MSFKDVTTTFDLILIDTRLHYILDNNSLKHCCLPKTKSGLKIYPSNIFSCIYLFNSPLNK